jgi:hypothetical protein
MRLVWLSVMKGFWTLHAMPTNPHFYVAESDPTGHVYLMTAKRKHTCVARETIVTLLFRFI